MIYLKSICAWLIILVLAVANGVLRESILTPSFGPVGGLMLSGVLLSLIIALVAFTFVRLANGISVPQGYRIGLAWLLLTLIFEFSFGVWVQHKTLPEVLEAYAFRGGNLWLLVLLATLVSPAAAAWLDGKRRPSKRLI